MRNSYIRKTAGAANDLLGMGLGSAAPYLLGLGLLSTGIEKENKTLRNIGGAVIGGAALSGLAGGAHGFFSRKPTEEEMNAIDDNPELSYAPGVGASRTVRRMLHSVKNDRPHITAVSDTLGVPLSLILPTLAGGGIGKLVGGSKGAARGALLGGLLGYGANAAGLLAGSTKRRRTLKEQVEADEKHNALESLLIPGKGAYNSARRSAGIIREEDERNRKREEENEAMGKQASFKDAWFNFKHRKDPFMRYAKAQMEREKALDDAGITYFNPGPKPKEDLGWFFRNSSRLRNAYNDAKFQFDSITKDDPTSSIQVITNYVGKNNRDLENANRRINQLPEKNRQLGGFYENAKHSLPALTNTGRMYQNVLANSNPYETIV